MKPTTFSLLSIGLLLLAPQIHADAKSFVKMQGRGINLGNLLEAPSEGAWGVTLKKSDLQKIASKGLANVRIPIRWDGSGVGSATFDRVGRTSPYTVDPRFFERVDSAISWSRQNRLVVVINNHHHDTLFQHLEQERPRFIALWKQIAERYANLPDSVAFEILNEPNTQVTIDAWNSLLDTTLKVIRASNPTRPVVIGTANWGGLSGLSGLKLPDNDPNLILTIHYYEPFAFTHQGAEWTDPVPPVGVTWTGSHYEKLAVKQAMDAISDYANAKNVPVWIGEFGSYSKGDTASRARWTAYCARLFESYGFSWSYWEFKAGFGVYNETPNTWNAFLVDALLSNDTTILDPGQPPAGGVDLARNGGFASKTSWTLNGSQGAPLFSVAGGNAAVTIQDPATDAWGIQLIQSPVVIRKDLTHVLQFDAWASSPRSIDGGLGMSRTPWTGYVSAAAGLGTTPKTFYASFVPAATDSTARICFNLGPDTGIVHIDNVKLLVWDPSVGVRRKPSIPTLARPLVWSEGILRLEGARAPSFDRLVKADGSRAELLAWRKSPEGWTAKTRQDLSGVWIAPTRQDSRILVVP